MNTLTKIVFGISITLVISSCSLKNSTKFPVEFQIIPQPKKIKVTDAKGIKYGDLTALEMKGVSTRPVMGDILYRLPENSAKGPKLSLIIDSAFNEMSNPEGYKLTVKKNGIEIRARKEAGIFYGCQTLEQLLEDSRDKDVTIPSCEILDYPAIPYRAVHITLRHQLDHIDYYYKMIDRLARYKINGVIFEFEDKLRYRRQPDVASPISMSIEEVAALTEYAKERYIDISPLIQGLGHATYILKHEKYKHLRENPESKYAFCPMLDETYDVQFDLYLDAIEATPGSKYVHIGADEVDELGQCPRCKPVAQKYGIGKLNLIWLKKVSNFLLNHGRTPIFWDDMPFKQVSDDFYRTAWDNTITKEEYKKIWADGETKFIDLISDYPKGAVFMRWNYWGGYQPGTLSALKLYNKLGLKSMVSGAAQTIGCLFPFDERRPGKDLDGGPASLKGLAVVANENNIKGMLTCAWDDASPHIETFWKGFIASAEYSWSPDLKSLDEFDKAYMQREYGLAESNYYKIYKMLVESADFWAHAFYKNGKKTDVQNALTQIPGLANWVSEKEKEIQRTRNDFTPLLIDMPDLNKPGKWAERYADRLETARKIIGYYNNTSEKLNEYLYNSTKNRYHWELFNALNRFQVTYPKILLSLYKFDTTDVHSRKEARKEIQYSIDEFHKAWEDLQTIYAKTRFIKMPENFVKDRYFHLSSQREDLSWMILDEENIEKMISELLKQ